MRSLSEFGLREDDSVMEVKAASLSRSDAVGRMEVPMGLLESCSGRQLGILSNKHLEQA